MNGHHFVSTPFVSKDNRAMFVVVRDPESKSHHVLKVPAQLEDAERVMTCPYGEKGQPTQMASWSQAVNEARSLAAA